MQCSQTILGYKDNKVCSHCHLSNGRSKWICRCRVERSGSDLNCESCRSDKFKCCFCVEPDFSLLLGGEYIEGGKCLRCCLTDRQRSWRYQCGYNNYGDTFVCIKCEISRKKPCNCDQPQFNKRTTLESLIVDVGPCLNCQIVKPN